MNRHVPPFLLSIVIHLFLLIAFVYAYKEISSLFVKQKSQKVAISLQSFKSAASVETKKVNSETHVKQKQPKKIKKVKKIVKKVRKKPKKHLQKSVLSPKKVPLKEVKTIQKSLLEQAKEDRNKKESLDSQKVKTAAEKTSRQLSSKKLYLEENLERIVALLQENLYYPRRARKRAIEGDVVVKFTLSKDAEVLQSTIVSSSSDILSRAALKTLQELSGEFPKPKEKLIITLPIEYRLSR